ncbi:hypothetical protein [Caballeronia hypogeia]|uniref:hypothetical protein n=1 Tax=Caballeronia hypogeia TaxID=1777140 RepID=UPI0012FD8BF5|nr:hypothetical protein [Caballeronia hypogeia]
MAGILSARGYELVCAKSLRDAELAITRIVVKGANLGHWMLTEDELRAIKEVVGTFEEQIRRAPIADIEADFKNAKDIAGF